MELEITEENLPQFLEKLFRERPLDKARSDIRKNGEILLFEGFMDVIAGSAL